VSVWPDTQAPDAQGFALGSDWRGQNSVGGTIEEWTSFGYALSADEVAHYYKNTKPLADLGPVTEAEEQAVRAYFTSLRDLAAQKSALSLPGGGSLLMLLGYGTNDYGTNLWLEIESPGLESVGIILHNTTTDTRYQLLAREQATPGLWIVEETVFGATNQNWTTTTVHFRDRPIQFFQAGEDADGDGLVDYWEGVLGTSPGEQDSDSDGVNDYLEIIQGRDPLRSGADADTSGLLNFKVYTPFR
jgi:hypothetical protein